MFRPLLLSVLLAAGCLSPVGISGSSNDAAAPGADSGELAPDAAVAGLDAAAPRLDAAVAGPDAAVAVPDAAHSLDASSAWDAAIPPDAGSLAGCATLDEAACLARKDCATDYCFACSCTPAFAGCRDTNATPTTCPAYGCAAPQCCSSQSDCPSYEICLAPGQSAGCGMCNPSPSTCANDADCPATEICEPIPCSCDNGTECVPGCSLDYDCAEGQVCEGSGTGSDGRRCESRPCSQGCPATFGCVNNQCERLSCSDASPCPTGFCVDGQCFSSHGQCTMQPE